MFWELRMANTLVEQVLQYLAQHEEANSLDLVGIIDDDHQKIIGAIKSLQTLPDVSFCWHYTSFPKHFQKSKKMWLNSFLGDKTNFFKVIRVEQTSQRKWEPTEEGQHVIDYGSHEAALYNAIPEGGIVQSELMKNLPYAKVGLSKALQAGWVKLSKKDGMPFLDKNTPSIVDNTQIHLKDLDTVPDNVKAEYKKRKLLQEV